MLRPSAIPTSSKPVPAPPLGFTLIELILVMSILLVVIAVSAPSLKRFFESRALTSEARRLLTLTRYGQSRAVSEGVPVVLWIDERARRYGLQTAESYRLTDPKAVEFQWNERIELKVVQAASTQPVLLSSFDQLQQISTRRPEIRFLPSGAVTPTSLAQVRLRQDEQDLWLVQATNRLTYELHSLQPKTHAW